MADRRSFGTVVGAGLASAVLAAVAGRQPWAHGSAPGGLGELSATAEAGTVAAASALSLVVLACWGVLLVTRGVVRRIVAVLGLLAALGLAAAVVVGFSAAPHRVEEAYMALGVAHPDVGRTGWYWTAAVATLLTLVTMAGAVRLVPSWPEMGRKYDAPVEPAPAATRAAPEDQENLDL